MVRVDSEQNVRFPDEKNRVTKNSQNNVNSELSKAFNSNENSEDLCVNSTKLKANDLDFTVFPKANRADAAHFAERSLNEVRDLARDFNSDYPDKPYVVNENNFPRPEDFPKKNYGGKDNAYNAWKNAVTEWVEDIKQDIALKKSTHLAELSTTIDLYTREINAKLDRNYFANEIAEGVTRQFIVDTYVALKGNLSAVEAAVHKEAARIREEVKSTILTDGEKTREQINKKSQEIKGTVIIEGMYTRNTIRTENKESQEINALSVAISSAINVTEGKTVLGFGNITKEHRDKIIKDVENLKNDIISSNRISHSKKIELLTKLRDLVIQDEWITRKDLRKLLEDTRRIIL